MTQQRKRNRRNKIDNREQKVLSGEKQNLEVRERKEKTIKPLTAKNERQKQALRDLELKQMVVLSGSAGSGKTEVACWYAAKEWLKGDIDNIIITRPNISMGGDNAPIPGNDFQKILPYTMSMLMKFKKYLGAGILKNNLRQEMQDTLFNDVSGIQVYSLEKLNGLSFDNRTLVIADEIQSCTVAQMKSLLTRMEKGSKLVLCGDPVQSAIGSKNGLNFLLRTLKNNPHEDISVISFKPEDCCREGISAHFTAIFEGQGEWV